MIGAYARDVNAEPGIFFGRFLLPSHRPSPDQEKCMPFNKRCPRVFRFCDILSVSPGSATLFRKYCTTGRIHPVVSISRGFLCRSQPRILTTLGMTRTPQRRLNHILKDLTPAPPIIGQLKLGDITYEIPVARTPSRLARSKELLDIHDPVNVDNLHFMLQKYLLGQDVFLVSQPGPYARRLALTFARFDAYPVLGRSTLLIIQYFNTVSSTQNMNISHCIEMLARRS